MLRKLIEWALDNPVVVIALAMTLAGVGVYAFLHVNVEAYPDPAPAIVEVFGQIPGALGRRDRTAGHRPAGNYLRRYARHEVIRSKSLFGLSDFKMNWKYGGRMDYEAGRQEVINRIATISQPFPRT